MPRNILQTHIGNRKLRYVSGVKKRIDMTGRIKKRAAYPLFSYFYVVCYELGKQIDHRVPLLVHPAIIATEFDQFAYRVEEVRLC